MFVIVEWSILQFDASTGEWIFEITLDGAGPFEGFFGIDLSNLNMLAFGQSPSGYATIYFDMGTNN